MLIKLMNSKNFQKLKKYIEYLEKELMIPIKIVSVGPDRNETIHR